MLRDFRLAIRLLGRNPAFTAVAVLAIALGIGANTALFSVVYAVVLKPLPYPEAERLTMVWETRPDRGKFNNVVSNANFLDWRTRNQVFDAMSPIFFLTQTVTGVGEPEDVRAQLVNEDYFPMLGVQMQRGRAFRAEECKPGGPVLVVLSDAYWRSRLRADPAAVGRTLRVGSEAATIVGIAPAGLTVPGDQPPALWRNSRVSGVNSNGARSSGRNMAVLARLKRGVTPEAADQHMVAIARQLELEYPQANAKWSARVVPLSEELTGKARTPLFVMLGAVACVLLIACANVGNLLLARATGRTRELAVRVSLGATRTMLLRQMLAESVTLALAGAVSGLVLGQGLLMFLKAAGPVELRRLESASLDLPVLGFTLGLALVTGVLLGLLPAWTATRGLLESTMREGGRGLTSTRRANFIREAFTVAEIALALVLLTGAGLLLKSFARLTAVDPGFRAEKVLTANVSLSGQRYRGDKGTLFFAELNRRLRALPGVVNASIITFLPFKGTGSGTYFWRSDKPRPAPGQEPVTDVRMIQPGYFETMAIPLRRGRAFTEADNDPKAPLRFVISESTARQMFPGEDPIGRQLVVMMQQDNPPGEIIGVVGDVKHGSLEEKTRPFVYYPQAQLFFGFGTVVVQSSAADPLGLARPVTALIHEMDPELAVSEVGTMQRWVDASVARPQFQSRLLAGFAALALVLAVIGIFGVMSYGVAQRTREIGVRLAVGAQRGQVSRMILRHGLRLTVTGLVIGVAGALALGRWLETLLYDVRPADPATIGGTVALLLVVSLAAAYWPAVRASRVDPLKCLRYE